MTFKIRKVWTRHLLTHGKDFALVELSFSEDAPEDIQSGYRFGTIEYGKTEVCLLDVCGGKTLNDAIKNRENFEDLLDLFAKYGRDPEAFKNPEFKREFEKLNAR